ncbi:HNH endonuclease [Bacteroides sp.]|uniref:HNH endonuclease n=1 Tax=Bacteroides sp. TaxID=29523 RepID=UPI002FCA18CD
MIKLIKSQEPDILAQYGKQWTNDLMVYANSDRKVPDGIKNKYNHSDIKKALIKETHGKCMYCESYISAVAPEHIEHYRPKAVYPEQTFEWSNLGLACPWCNIKKSDAFDEACAIVNPYIEDPDDFFVSLGTFVYHKPNNKRAELTEHLLELNRPELIEGRKHILDNIRPLIDRYVSETNPSLKQLIWDNIKKEMGDDKPYAMCVRKLVSILIDLK